jgi:hypothetical protein
VGHRRNQRYSRRPFAAECRQDKEEAHLTFPRVALARAERERSIAGILAFLGRSGVGKRDAAGKRARVGAKPFPPREIRSSLRAIP